MSTLVFRWLSALAHSDIRLVQRQPPHQYRRAGPAKELDLHVQRLQVLFRNQSRESGILVFLTSCSRPHIFQSRSMTDRHSISSQDPSRN